MTELLIGCDPELFLRDPQTGSFVSGHGALPGSKAEPYKVRMGAVQIDGTALEFNTDPAKTKDEFLNNVNVVMAEMKNMLVENHEIVIAPVADYDPTYFETIPEAARELGCNPDFSGWTLGENPVPNAKVTFRTGSGHVHLGWGNGFDVEDWDHFEFCARLARQLDAYLGVATLLWDQDDRRRNLYGKAGAFRPKPYGMEYRVPSNSWLSRDSLREFVYEACVKAFNDLKAGDDKCEKFADKARNIIDNNDVTWFAREGDVFETGLDYSKVA